MAAAIVHRRAAYTWFWDLCEGAIIQRLLHLLVRDDEQGSVR
jgi:hypothetical protein